MRTVAAFVALASLVGCAPRDDAPRESIASRETVATDLFHKTFGNPADRPVVFLHGGPGANSVMFDTSAAEALARRGNFVVTYDQRGSGRSPSASLEDFTYAKATRDLDDLVRALHLKQPIFIGHSWGGTLAVQYLERYPNAATGAVLVGNPVDYPDALFNIHQRCLDYYAGQPSSDAQAAQVRALNRRMFPNGLTPPFHFEQGDLQATMGRSVGCGLVFPHHPTDDALALWSKVLDGPDGVLSTAIAAGPASGFETNEHLNESEFSADFSGLRAKLYGIYGSEDGLVSDNQTAQIRSLVSPEHFTLVEGASHVVFLDQEATFLDVLSGYLDALSGSR